MDLEQYRDLFIEQLRKEIDWNFVKVGKSKINVTKGYTKFIIAVREGTESKWSAKCYQVGSCRDIYCYRNLDSMEPIELIKNFILNNEGYHSQQITEQIQKSRQDIRDLREMIMKLEFFTRSNGSITARDCCDD
nr:hypothetical protein K-LCC10_0284 [Kaumoebavirus]